MNENVAGISIADGVVSCARIVRRGPRKIGLTHAGWAEYAPDASDADIAKVIRRLWKKTKMPTRSVCNGLQSRSLCVKYFRFPELLERELASALRYEAEESLQLPPHQIAYDWHLNRPRNGADPSAKEPLNGVLIAVAKHEVVRQLNLLKKAGLYPVMTDVGCTSLCNLYLALRGEKVNANNAVCVVNLTRYNADISILYNDHFIYPRTVISRSAEWSVKVQYLIENISDALLYYHVKVDKAPVTQLILTGALPETKGFVAQIHDTIGLPTEVWSPLRDENFVVSGRVKTTALDNAFSPFMTASLALGLRNA